MSKRVTIRELKTHLSELVARAEKGETIIICRAGNPVAKLTAVRTKGKARRAKFGYGKDDIRIIGDVAAPLDEEELKLFYDGPIFPQK